ncbi:hypothetical protein D4T97_009050 [Siminovitchia acidinfaciens]|uniref:Copper amine oxidase-like N-terminal domain-containing protein n=1 Tax=Siminovitchia acidinfaciens TaxID=2321395 RepID=A0A429Y2A5_9BACI|nr:stalk domain-containing protein [Siminovitchia acidinfaciens]RST75381.1 hypothetical protein D4T97_009050 [Siminovitchia acidinfaciens]
MTRRIFHFSLLMAAVIGSILFIQWKGYSVEKDKAVANLEQTVVVRHGADEFSIKQVINNLPEGQYQIRFPEKASDTNCLSAENKACKWVSGKGNKLKGNGMPVTFTYKLKAPTNPSEYWLENWGANIEGVSYSFTRVQLTELSWRKGSWAASDELAGKQKMDAIDYYVFEKEGGLPALYWNSKDLLPKEMNHHLTIYTEGNLPLNQAVFQKLVPNEKISVIISSIAEEVTEKGGLLFVPAQTEDANEQLARLLLKKKITLKKEEEWYIDLIASLMTGKVVDNKKVEKMRKTITSILTEDQLERWLESILSVETGLSSSKMDELLESTANIKTDFFQKNAEVSQPYQPFYFMDTRELYVNGHKAGDMKILIQNDRTYISFIPLIKRLGFHIESSSKKGEIVINKRGDRYNFFFSKKIFDLNGEQLGFRKNPFFVDQKEVYIDTAALSTLFGVNMVENTNEINIK